MDIRRIAYLDIVKLVTIYLVILGHVLIKMDPDLSVGGKLYAFIYTFHMPLFVLLSGYFSGSACSKPFFVFIRNKVRQLLLPAATCAVIVCVYLYVVRSQTDFRDEIIGNSWFLKILFVYYVLFYLLKQTKVNDWMLFVTSAVLLFLIPICSSLQMNLLYPYFWCGFFMRKYDVLEKLCSGQYLLLVVMVFIGLYACKLEYGIPTYIPIYKDTLFGYWHLIAFRYLIGFVGCLMVIMLVSLLYNGFYKSEGQSCLAEYGKKTLGVYVLQTILVINIFPDMYQWNVESEVMLDVVFAPTISVCFLAICLWLISVLSKSRILDLLFFGGQYYKR